MSFVEAISEVSENIFWLLAMPKVRLSDTDSDVPLMEFRAVRIQASHPKVSVIVSPSDPTLILIILQDSACRPGRP